MKDALITLVILLLIIVVLSIMTVLLLVITADVAHAHADDLQVEWTCRANVCEVQVLSLSGSQSIDGWIASSRDITSYFCEEDLTCVAYPKTHWHESGLNFSGTPVAGKLYTIYAAITDTPGGIMGFVHALDSDEYYLGDNFSVAFALYLPGIH